MVAAQETSLQKILEGTCQYLVPLYQRPYQWGPDNFKEFWRDITQLAEDRTTDIETTHFIGSVVLAPVPAGVAGTITQYLVVDGQQRFTTPILLLAAIRDHLRAIDDTTRRDTDRIHNQLLDSRKAGPTSGARSTGPNQRGRVTCSIPPRRPSRHLLLSGAGHRRVHPPSDRVCGHSAGGLETFSTGHPPRTEHRKQG